MVTIGDLHAETPKPDSEWRNTPADIRLGIVSEILIDGCFTELEATEAHADGRVVVRLNVDMTTELLGRVLRAAEKQITAIYPFIRLYLQSSGDINALRRVTRGVEVLEGFAGGSD